MRFAINHLKFWCCCLIVSIVIWIYPVLPIWADQTIAETPIKIKISLSNAANQLKFFPDKVQLVAGKKYKLLLSNPSAQKHYFTAKDFSGSSWTQKVDAGNVEIKGAIQELELRPGSTAAWVLVPMKPGNYTLRCTIPGHTEAGMTGTIAVDSAS
jgi:uncharacterized cupredoxin-like copper-binding protein